MMMVHKKIYIFTLQFVLFGFPKRVKTKIAQWYRFTKTTHSSWICFAVCQEKNTLMEEEVITQETWTLTHRFSARLQESSYSVLHPSSSLLHNGLFTRQQVKPLMTHHIQAECIDLKYNYHHKYLDAGLIIVKVHLLNFINHMFIFNFPAAATMGCSWKWLNVTSIGRFSVHNHIKQGPY